MATKVRVRDFQSIHDATVEIDGFTVITGPNNSGKTALQRAVRGVFENTGGTAFVRHGTSKCIVDLEFSDGHSVTWEKGTNSKPAYRVDGGNPVYPGRQVPDEVRDLGVKPIPAGGQEVWPNIAPQFTGQVFLIDKPGSVLAEAVADVERVGHLNRALRRVAGDQTRNNADLRVRQEDQAIQERHLLFFEGLDEIETQVADLEKLEERTARIGRARDGLSDLRMRLTKAQTVVGRYEGVDQIELPAAGDLDGDVARLQVLYQLRSRLEATRSRVDRFSGVDQISTPVTVVMEELQQEMGVLRSLRDRVRVCSRSISRYAGLTGLGTTVSATSVEGLLLGLGEWTQLRKQWVTATDEVSSAATGLRALEVGVDEARREFDEALAEMGACPLCGHAVESSA